MALRARLRALIVRLRGSGLAAESAWGLVLELATLVGMVLSFTLLGRSLGPAGYGGYASLYAIVGPLVTLAASGVVLALLQHVVRDLEPLAQTARSCLTLTLVLGVLLTVVGGGIASLVVESLTAVAITTILLTEFVTSPMVHVAATTVQAATGFTGAAKIRLVLVVARAMVLVALFLANSLTVATLGVCMLLVSGVLAIVSLHQVGGQYGFAFTPGRVHVSHLKTNLLYSSAISASSLNNDGDKLVMAANGLVVDTGLYAAAYRIVSFGMIPIGSLVAVSHRRFLEHEEGVRGQHLARSLRFGAVSGGYGLVFGSRCSSPPPCCRWCWVPDFEGSVVMVRWLTPTVMMRSLAIFSLNGLMGLGRVGLRSVIVIVNAGGGDGALRRAHPALRVGGRGDRHAHQRDDRRGQHVDRSARLPAARRPGDRPAARDRGYR